VAIKPIELDASDLLVSRFSSRSGPEKLIFSNGMDVSLQDGI